MRQDCANERRHCLVVHLDGRPIRPGRFGFRPPTIEKEGEKTMMQEHETNPLVDEIPEMIRDEIFKEGEKRKGKERNIG